MLGKILKYDLKATLRSFLPMYAVIGILTIFNKLFLEFTSFDTGNKVVAAIEGTFLAFYIIGLIGITFLTFIFLIVHFYKRMTGDEAYLTFTLPVKLTTQINGKLLISVFWSLMTGLVVSISLLILAAGHGVTDVFARMSLEIGKFLSDYGNTGSIVTLTILFILLMIVSAFSGFLMVYASISIGHLFGKHRILGAIGSYIGINMVLQVISVIRLSFTSFQNIDPSLDPFGFIQSINNYMIFTLVYNIVIAVIYYFITVYVFGKKLNLE